MKPDVVRKIASYVHKCTAAGKNSAVRGFQISYKLMCNFNCSHCYVRAPAAKSVESLALGDIKKMADEFDRLNAWEVGIQGGEPLLFPDLEALIAAIGPSRFYVCLITNGYLMTDEMAVKLACLGVDRVAVSIDGFTAEEHDELRNKKNSFNRCLLALESIRKAGMTPAINMVIGSYNVRSDGFVKFLEFAQKNHYQIVVNPATSTGAWRGKYDIMLSEDDSRYLTGLKEKYPVIMRDIWNFAQTKKTEVWGDPAGNLYFISSKGDIFPHPYIFIKLGNVHTTSIADAVRKAWKAKCFRDKSAKSLAGEDVSFVKKYLSHDMSVMEPVDFEEAFSVDDLYASGENEIIENSVNDEVQKNSAL